MDVALAVPGEDIQLETGKTLAAELDGLGDRRGWLAFLRFRSCLRRPSATSSRV